MIFQNGEVDHEEITCHRIGNILCSWLISVSPRSRRRCWGRSRRGWRWGGRRRWSAGGGPVAVIPQWITKIQVEGKRERRERPGNRQSGSSSAQPHGHAQRDGTTVRLFTRNGYDWSGRFPLIVEAALRNRNRSFVTDGEAVPLRLQRPASRRHDAKCSSMPSISWRKASAVRPSK